MANWAEIDSNNVVTRVVVTDNNAPEGDEGYSWLVNNLGGNWVKTSYNTAAGSHLLGGTPFRKNYAGIGFTYDEDLDAFIPPKPFDSWLLNEVRYQWEAPTPYPQDGKEYEWSEEDLTWKEVI
jgi:hypothetical protein